MLKQKEVALNHMTIGTHESSDQALYFTTTRPIRDWEDIEIIDANYRLDAIPAKLIGKRIKTPAKYGRLRRHSGPTFSEGEAT